MSIRIARRWRPPEAIKRDVADPFLGRAIALLASSLELFVSPRVRVCVYGAQPVDLEPSPDQGFALLRFVLVDD
jgi:hypothetical protein